MNDSAGSSGQSSLVVASGPSVSESGVNASDPSGGVAAGSSGSVVAGAGASGSPTDDSPCLLVNYTSSGIGVQQPEDPEAAYVPGASVLVLAAKQKQPYGIATDETHVYWGTWGSDDASDATVMKVSKGGGALTTLASGYKWIGGIAVSASTVYFTGGYSTGGGVFGVGLDGGAVASLSSTFTNDNIAVGPGGVYGTDSHDSLVSVGLEGGPTATLSTGPDDSNTYGIAADATNVYWTNFANPATLQKVPVRGGPTVSLAPTKVAFGVALDATSVYWADAGDGTGIAPSPVELRVVAAARWDSYATFFSDATVTASGRRAATSEGMFA